jgi:hypothetical protein
MVEKSSQKTAKNKFTHTRIILFFGGIGVWTQSFSLANQAFHHLSYTSRPFCFGGFGDRISQTIYQGWPQTVILQISASSVSRSTDLHKYKKKKKKKTQTVNNLGLKLLLKYLFMLLQKHHRLSAIQTNEIYFSQFGRHEQGASRLGVSWVILLFTGTRLLL